ncbi:MAG: carbon-nitrogen hydrolase family protein [Verrucomicrobia bacterium]|nr:carbon-nitrogen hydrolase family protein [Verrucomicrobiota bacterium]
MKAILVLGGLALFAIAGLGQMPAMAAAPVVTRFNNFTAAEITNAAPGNWLAWAPREEIRPRFSVDKSGGRTGRGALAIKTAAPSEFGAWRSTISGLTGGRTYCFTAWYRARRVANERRSVSARLEWLDERGRAARMPDYALDAFTSNGWTQVRYVTAAPTNARSVEVQLSLGFAANAAVCWDDVELAEELSPPNRVVRALTVYHRPRGTKSAAESVEQFCRLVEGAAAQRPDMICLPEGITVVGNGKSYTEVSEPIPGPTTLRLGTLAKKLNSYLVAGIYERTNGLVFNTAVLLGRGGELLGAYRKTHLPREEWEKGITPGNQYPVFRTEFGKVGVMICWDLQFPEPARALAAQGAEMILLPIWGGSEVLARARAIENSVFLISATYDMRSFIVDPTGQVLAEATKDQPVATAELPLDRKFLQPWIGDMKTRAWKERRPDIPVP